MKPASRNKLFNRIGDAWNAGRADWLFDECGNVAVRLWCEVQRQGGPDAADDAVLNLARERGAL